MLNQGCRSKIKTSETNFFWILHDSRLTIDARGETLGFTVLPNDQVTGRVELRVNCASKGFLLFPLVIIVVQL